MKLSRYLMLPVVSLAFFIGCASTCFTGVNAVRQDSLNRTVWIDIYRPDGTGSCSGIILQTNIVLTAKHCFGEVMKVEGQSARVLAESEADDLLLVTTKTDTFAPLVVDETYYQGESVYVAGNYLKWKRLLTTGAIVGIFDDELLSSVPAAPGFSGSGLFSESGHLVGVNTQMRGHYVDGSPVVLFASSVTGKRIARFLHLNQNRIEMLKGIQ